MECVWLETSYFLKDITITPKVGLRKFKGEKYMSKTKGISKKKDVLKVFWNECAVFKVVVCILAYVILGFINIPINRWLTFHVPKWSDGKLHDITGSFFVLPILEVLAVTLIYLIANAFIPSARCSRTGITVTFRLRKMKLKERNLRMQMSIFPMSSMSFPMVLRMKKKISRLVMMIFEKCL